MSAPNSTLLIKGIYLPEQLAGEDIHGSAALSAVSSVEAATADVTYIVMTSGRFIAVKQPFAEVKTAIEKAAAEKAAAVDFMTLSMTGDEMRQRITTEREQRRQYEEREHRINKRWARLENFKLNKNKYKSKDHLTEADVRGIRILKQSAKQRAHEKEQEKRAARRAAIERWMFGWGQSLKKIFDMSASAKTAKPETPAQAATVSAPEAPAVAPVSATAPVKSPVAAVEEAAAPVKRAAKPAKAETPQAKADKKPPAAAPKKRKTTKKPAAPKPAG